MTAPLGQVLRFGVVGVAATLTHFLLLRAGVELAGVPPVPMNGLAFCAALLVTYLGQAVWVFRAPPDGPARLARFAASAVGGLLGNLAIMALVTQGLGLRYEVGFVLALLVVPALSFVVNRTWVFRPRRG